MADIKVRQEILLTSPSGRNYFALWAGGTRNVKKRLAMFSYAGINGQVVDDYGCDSVTYPINIIFDGPEHRKTAKEFFESFQETGRWLVNHPTEGVLGLQAVEATENDQPITQANITRVDTQWVEYIDPVTLKTLRNSKLELGFSLNELQDETLDSASITMEVSPAGLEEARGSGKSLLESVVTAYNKSQYALAEASNAQSEFTDNLNSAAINVVNLVSTAQNLILAPARGIADLKQRLKTLKRVFEELFDTKNDPIEPNVNDMVMREVCVTSILSSVAEGTTTATEDEESGLRSRSELLQLIADYDDFVDTMWVAMDEMAQDSITADMPVEQRYVPFERNRNQVKNIIAKTRNSLIQQFFRLPVETRIILKAPSTILDIARKYFGTTGSLDEALQKIEDSNIFTSNEILLLPAGTQVRLYG